MAEIPSTQPSQADCPNVAAQTSNKVDLKDARAPKDNLVEEEEKKLPKLSASEFRQYNHMAEHMNYYHNHFRHNWKTLYTACEANKRPSGLSIRQFVNMGLQFCSSLTMHHNIEEAHIFPVLARKMPAFQSEMEMKTAHKAIHAGLVRLEAWLEEVRGGERELNLKELKAIMDTFGTVLWQHLDEEVDQLGAENMRKFWTLAEMQRMPM